MALSYLTGSATQGSADAFVQAEISTALSGQTQRAFRVREVLFEHPLIAGNGANIAISLSRRSKTAEPVITDRDVMAKVNVSVSLTTSGAFPLERVRRLTWAEDDELLIVEDPIYLVVDSASTGAANTVYCRIGYELVNISAVDRLTLLTQSLQE
jgi:hypothetical protein